MAKVPNHVVQYPMEFSLCTGCESCEAVCALVHEGIVSPHRTRIKVRLGSTKTMIHTVLACEQCEDHPCYNACPKKDKAMKIDENGIVYIEPEECVGCGLCAKNCKFEEPRIYIVPNDSGRPKRRAIKCDLCRGRAEGPACVQWCPCKAIGLSDDSTEDLSAPLTVTGIPE